MKNLTSLLSFLLLSFLIVFTLGSCDPEGQEPVPAEPEQPTPVPDPTPPPVDEPKNTPFTSIPDELVGTWYAEKNPNPMTTNWDQGTFQGEFGTREFRTMVFTKDGKNAVEYTSWVSSETGDGNKFMFKRIGTLEYKRNPNSLTFHVQSGKVRHYSNKFTGYKESDLNSKDWPTYLSVLVNPEATSYTSSTNYLSAKRSNGNGEYSVKYTKVSTTTPDGGTSNPGDLYTNPPATGTYVKIASLYYPTVTIGDQEWMAVNLAGPGGMKDSSKPHFGTFFKFLDLKNIPVPAGWRIPNKQDYIKLIQSQGLEFTSWGSTDGSEIQSKKLLGQLMATTGWLKQDGYASNKSGFNAFPANYKVQDASPFGEGTRCLLWTSEVNSSDSPMVFQIVQLPSETYASFTPFPLGYYPQHLPIRLVKNK